MANENLKDLLKEIMEVEKIARMDPEEYPWPARNGLVGAKKEAQAQLDVLTARYCSAIQGKTVGIFAVGNNYERFVELARSESASPIAVIYADDMYKQLADRVERSLGKSREFAPNQMSIVLQNLTNLCVDLEIRDFETPRFIESGPLADTRAVLSHVRNIIRNGLGDDMNRMYIAKQIGKEAVSSRHVASVLPVIVVGLESEDEASGLNQVTARFGTQVVIPDTVTKEFVLDVFSEVKEKLKGVKSK